MVEATDRFATAAKPAYGLALHPKIVLTEFHLGEVLMLRLLSIPGRAHENPFFSLLADALEAEGAVIVPPSARNTATFAYDVLHLNFPTHYITQNNVFKAFFLSVLLGSYLIVARLLGRRIIYTAHDVVPIRVRHTGLTRSFLWLVHRLTNAFVFLSASSRAEFVRIYPADCDKPWTLALHGPYPTLRLTSAERSQHRRALSDDDSLLIGFLGRIKPYKNIAALDAMPTHLANGRAIKVLVAGRSEAGHENDAAEVLRRRPEGSVIRIDEQLTDARLDELIQAVDLVLLPYTKGSNSGAALLVLSNRGRLIGSDIPIFQELAVSVGPPWAYAFSNDNGSHPDLRTTLEHAAAQTITTTDLNALDAYFDQASYKSMARAVNTLCMSISR